MKKFILSTIIIASAISCLVTSCSQDDEWGMDAYSTLACEKMTRSIDYPVLALQINDSTTYNYDIILKDGKKYSHKANIYFQFIQDDVELRVEMHSYSLYHDCIDETCAGLYTVDNIWLRKENRFGNRYYLCAEGMNSASHICYGELENIVFLE